MTMGSEAGEGRALPDAPQGAPSRAIRRIALGVSYVGSAYKGWQSQPSGGTVQDVLESALAKFAVRPLKVLCAGRTDAGVHGINQVVHLDTPLSREPFSWVRGTNRYLPHDIAGLHAVARRQVGLGQVAVEREVAVAVVEDHPLARATRPTLADVAAYPIVTYEVIFTGRPHIDEAFARAGITPDIVLTALDSDVIKTYVREGLGIGIIAAMAFDARADCGHFVCFDCRRIMAIKNREARVSHKLDAGL